MNSLLKIVAKKKKKKMMMMLPNDDAKKSCHSESCRRAGHMQQRFLFHRCCFWPSYLPR